MEFKFTHESVTKILDTDAKSLSHVIGRAKERILSKQCAFVLNGKQRTFSINIALVKKRQKNKISVLEGSLPFESKMVVYSKDSKAEDTTVKDTTGKDIEKDDKVEEKTVIEDIKDNIKESSDDKKVDEKAATDVKKENDVKTDKSKAVKTAVGVKTK